MVLLRFAAPIRDFSVTDLPSNDDPQSDAPRLMVPPIAWPGGGFIAVTLSIASIAFFMGTAWSSAPWSMTIAGMVGGALTTLGLRKWLQHQQRFHHATLVSATRQAQAQIDRLREHWRRLHGETRQNASALLQLVDGVVVLSPNETILLINPSAVRLLNLKRREGLLGRSFTELVRLPELVEAIRNVVAEQQTQEITVEFQHDGGIRPIRIRVDRIDAGDQQNLQLCLRDETEPRRVEEMRREFVANVSHELKTPLAAIKGYAETIELAIGDDPEMARHFVLQITNQCRRLESLVHDMMRLAKAQTGREHFNLASVSLRDIIDESVRTYAPVSIASSLQLHWIPPDDQCKVLADREAVLTIINNLIGNAVRYTRAGGEIRVSLQSETDWWCIAVADTGEGIAEEDLTRIFERFYRGSRNAESPSSSTGLGLAIVKNLSQALGGDVRVQSRLGHGSTFEVRLPVPHRPSRVANANPPKGRVSKERVADELIPDERGPNERPPNERPPNEPAPNEPATNQRAPDEQAGAVAAAVSDAQVGPETTPEATVEQEPENSKPAVQAIG